MVQELRFIISSVPMFNLSAAVAVNRMYVASPITYLFFNQNQSVWCVLVIMLNAGDDYS